MQFLYTGAATDGAEQLDPELSLGGFISSSVIPNDSLQNIFSEASYLSIQQKKREIKMIVLKNDSTTQAANSITLTPTLNDSSIGKYRIAIVLPDDNGCFEEVINSSVMPYYATFQDIVSETTIDLPNIAADDYIGLWIIRDYDFESDELATHDLAYWEAELLDPTTPDLQDSLELEVDYTLV